MLQSTMFNRGIDFIQPTISQIVGNFREPMSWVAPKNSFSITSGSYTVKIADTAEEVYEAQMLRYQVFHCEMGGKKFPFGLDRDYYDQFSDILIVRDNSNHKIVGTYRLIASNSSSANDFYCRTEFDLSPVLELPGNKLELSRACIHKNYRNGRIISLLWKGIGRYIQISESEIVFGMSSFKEISRHRLAALVSHLEQTGYLSDTLNVRVLPEYKVRSDILNLVPSDSPTPESLESDIPALVRSYLRAGAVLCSEPALDQKFKCIDFLTLWDLRNNDTMRLRRYFQ